MPYSAQKLITRSYYLSGKVSKELEDITGEEIYEGLELLNNLLSFKTAAQRVIPYFDQVEFPAVVGVGQYFVPNLILAESLTFNNQSVRYSTNYYSRKQFFATPYIDNINALPYSWHYERTLDGSNIYLQFNPDQTYPIKVWGKFSLTNVSLNTDLLIYYDAFFIEYLRYSLARKICQEYRLVFDPTLAKELEEMESAVLDISPMDLVMTKYSSLQQDSSGLNWGDVNFGHGWRP